MTAYREVKVLSDVDAAYVAGLIDGEGTITLSRRHAGQHRQLVVTISNTERGLLNFVLDVAGAGKITSKVRYQEHHAPGYTYGISNRQALALLRQIEPHLRSYKFRRARLVLDHYIRLTPRNGKYTATQLRRRETFVDRFFSITPHGGQDGRVIPGDTAMQT